MIEEAVISIHTNNAFSNISFRISDLSGLEVYTQSDITIKDGQSQIIINKNMLQTGIYFYEFVCNHQSIGKGKLMVK